MLMRIAAPLHDGRRDGAVAGELDGRDDFLGAKGLGKAPGLQAVLVLVDTAGDIKRKHQGQLAMRRRHR